ncbi:hypothetical protein ABW21_db0203901 [Orbilia brochopaga]|nr:hypothetical protein ABW21_db0203901 [Drechslerella brochopaga]
MASNYYAYTYGNTSYSQNQPFQEQYSSAPSQSSQTYYSNEHAQSHQTSSSARPPAPEARSATTQYNGLHFPAPAPVRQTATSHDVSRAAGTTSAVAGSAAGRSHGAGSGTATGYGNAGLYQSSTNSTSSQPSRPRTDGVVRHHDRAEQALSSAGWTASSNTLSVNHQTSSATPSTDYGYSYQKSDSSSQQPYYGSQRASTTGTVHSAPVNTGYDHATSYNGSTSHTQAQASSASKSRQPTQPYRQAAQNTASTSSYGRSYENAPSRTDISSLSASSHQQTSEYGKPYQDDAEQGQSYLQRIYTLPQPTPTRTGAETTNSYFANAPSSDSSYASSSQPSKPGTSYQTTYERPVSDSARDTTHAGPTSTHNYTSTPSSRSNQQYYPTYHSVDSHDPISRHTNSTSTPQPAAPTAPTAPTPVTQRAAASTSQPTSQTKRQRVSASQKPSTPKSASQRASKKSKASATVAAPAPTIDHTEASEPPKHTYYPAASGSFSQPSSAHRDHAADRSQTMASRNDVPVQDLTANMAPAPVPASSQPVPSSADPVSEMAFMEQHMREMVEKMREYQAKDPSAFQQVWENVKRSGPATAGGKSAGPLSMSTSSGTPGMNSPSQGSATLAKPVRQAAQQTTPAAPASDGGRNTPVPGSAASEAQQTVWPANQKTALSKTASKFLRNLGQTCSESFILGLLDFGPTFSELCQKLESQGYKFERNKFASELLKTSEAESPAGAKAARSTAAPAISAATPATPSAPPSAFTSTAQSTDHTQFITPQMIKSFNPRNIKDSIPSFLPPDNSHDLSQGFVTPSMIYREVYPTHFTQPESNVRSEEQSATPAPAPVPKSPAPAPAPAAMPAPQPAKARRSVSTKKRVALNKDSLRPVTETVSAPHTPLTIATPTSQAPVAPQASVLSATREEAMPDARYHWSLNLLPVLSSYQNSPIAMAPPNSRLETIYDPQNAGMPSLPSNNEEDSSDLLRLQSKLQAQLSKFETLEMPRPPPSLPMPITLPSNRPPVPQAPPSRKPLLQRPSALDRKNALRRNTYDPQSIVYAVLAATGRHPHYESLNGGLSVLKRLHPEAFDNSTDLAQINWDLYDPPPAPLPGEERRGRKNSVVVDEGETRGRKRDPVPLTPVTPVVDPAPVTPASSEGKTRGKRGRPRGSRGVPRGRGRGSAVASGTGSVQSHGPGPDQSTAANAHKYGTLTRVNIHSLNGSGNGGRKRKHGESPHSRHPGSPRDSNGRPSLLPVFKCQWENCDQNLQNLDTLRRHLLKKHKVENSQGVIPCCWGDCGSLIPILSQDPETGKKFIEQHRKRLNFGTGVAWDYHVLDEHLRSVRDTLGEGMSVKAAHSVEGRIRSMSRDREGRSITPIVTPAPFGYKFTPPPGFSSNSQFRLAHEFDNGLPDEKKMLEEELARAERTGAGMESFGIPMMPGIEYDDGRGYSMKSKKLTRDLSVLPAHPVPKADKEKRESEGKGKERAV